MNYLGLDYGLTYLGLAYSDGSLATPLTTITTSKALNLLPEYISRLSVDTLIIGLPQGPVQKPARKFISQLHLLGKPVHIVDETLTSFDARSRLLHTTRSRRREKEHAAAAAIILQSWLDAGPSPV